MISLRLKLENLERSSSDHRLRTGELAERYGEAQREITRSHESLKEQTTQIEQFKIEVDGLNTNIATLTEEKESALRELKEVQSTAARSDRQLQLDISALNEQIAQLEATHRAHIAEFQLELSSMQSRAKMDSESADVLDGYKKRAQVAMKKVCDACCLVRCAVCLCVCVYVVCFLYYVHCSSRVFLKSSSTRLYRQANATAATLTQENTALKSQMEECAACVSEMESAMRAVEEREEGLLAQIKELE